jgi:selenide, water dikinase
MLPDNQLRLTQYSRGGGCGCKIGPDVLTELLGSHEEIRPANLLVNQDTLDDASVWDLGNGTVLISTIDFFTPVVDDPYAFGRIAAANAISDVYAMGGTPLLAHAVLGWPVATLSAAIARSVIAGGRAACAECGIPLAGGHSINNLEPIFGLAVNGIAPLENVRRNSTAKPGDVLLLTKPLGTGILATAGKFGMLSEEDRNHATECMVALNRIGAVLGAEPGVHAITDVTGFGLLGHLLEMCDASKVSAVLYWNAVPVLGNVSRYIAEGATPSGTARNWSHCRSRAYLENDDWRTVLCDPQTNGGLLVSVSEQSLLHIQSVLAQNDLEARVHPVGRIEELKLDAPAVTVLSADHM